MNPTLLRHASGVSTPRSSRYTLLWLLAGVYLAVSAATRAVLTAVAWDAGQVGAADLARIFAAGTGSDLVTLLYLAALPALYLALLPQRVFRTRLHRLFAWGAMGALLFGTIYLGAVEYYFFDEFNARFNFVAVEYLIYPHEVFVNIWQSYPVARALVASAILAVCVLVAFSRPLADALKHESRCTQRIPTAAALLATLVAVHAGLNAMPERGKPGHNRVADELAVNGIYSFFDAAINNRLDYTRYYLTLDPVEAAARARQLTAQPNARFVQGAANPLTRRVTYAGTSRPLHVVVLLEESLGAEFVGAYGAARSLTPNLDHIAAQGLVFSNTYATGTRTVRGMEAVTASFPPVPAEAIVKRRHNEGMFNWSTVMRNNGYSPTFIYGGYGTFDNMNYFFSHNGYRVIDRADMDAPDFSNIWGVSDVDLFRNALRVFDRQHAAGERIFSVIMTTSNHKPFTFPAGIDGVKPAGGGRESGVRYADHAIGWFIDHLRGKTYADDTLVVIVADHGARVYGREDIPLPTYEIPFIVYSPRNVAPGRVEALTSQIDVAPTVLGLLNISYDSVFFGKDVLAAGPEQQRALLNHNRDVALYADDKLFELGFRGRQVTFGYDRAARRQYLAPPDPDGIRDVASVFQVAYDQYRRRTYRID